MMRRARLNRVFGAAIVMAALSTAGLARAAEWIERPYDPPVGSRWIIQAETRTEDKKQDAPEVTVVRSNSELTIDEKLPDGFRVSYVMKDVTVEGSTKQAEIARGLVSSLKGIVARGKLDAGGKPVEIENYDEVRANLQKMVDGMLASFAEQPQVAGLLRQMFNNSLMVDKSRAAQVYFEELPALAVAQNTGLKRGDVRKTTEAVPNPLGGAPIVSNQSLSITMTDADSGKARFVRASELDNEAIRGFALGVVKQLGGAMKGISPAELENLIKQISLRNDQRTAYDVENGMTRSIRDESQLSVSAVGITFTKTETKTVTVSQAP